MIPHENEANFEFGQNKLLESGTSPHAWGLWRKIRIGERISWFIPTCVGFILSTSKTGTQRSGSSPRAWGLWGHHAVSLADIRFIPTCVGVMTIFVDQQYETTVHPHVRGVYVAKDGVHPLHGRFIPTCVGFMYRCLRVWGQLLGSSPRAWGLWMTDQGCTEQSTVHPHVRGVYEDANKLVVKGVRFIPTCVGFMTNRTGSPGKFTGSSPRAWGLSSSP